MALTTDKTDPSAIEARAHQIAAGMPDMFPFGYAMFLAEQEAAEAAAAE